MDIKDRVKYHDITVPDIEEYDEHGRLTRQVFNKDFPGSAIFYDHTVITDRHRRSSSIKWTPSHREGMWRIASLLPDGAIEEFRYIQDGVFHYDAGPAHIKWNDHGYRTSETWYQHGKEHRTDGPARIDLYQDGSWFEEWFVEGVRHRQGGPALVSCRKGRDTVEEWYQNGKLFREDDQPTRVAWSSPRMHKKLREQWVLRHMEENAPRDMRREGPGPIVVDYGHDGRPERALSRAEDGSIAEWKRGRKKTMKLASYKNRGFDVVTPRRRVPGILESLR